MATRKPVVLLASGYGEMPSGDACDATALGFTTGSGSSGTSSGSSLWRRSPDGQIEQRGEVTLSAGLATIAFPIPFTATNIHVDLTPVLATGAAAAPSTYLVGEPTLAAATIGGTTTTAGLTGVVALASFKVRWRATGS